MGGYIRYLLGFTILTLLSKDSAGSTGIPAIIYLDTTATIIQDQQNGMTATPAAGVLGRIAYTGFGGTPTHYYIRDGVIDMVTNGGTATNRLTYPGGVVHDIATCCGRIFSVIGLGSNYVLTVTFGGFTKQLFVFENPMCTPRIAVFCTNRILYITTDVGISSWDFSDINMNALGTFSTSLGTPFPQDANFGSCPLDLEYTANGATPILYMTLMNSKRVFQSAASAPITLFKEFTAHDVVTFITADINCLYYGSLTGAVHAIYSQSRSAPGDPAALLASGVQVSGLTICETAGCTETCPATCCAGGCGLCLPAGTGTTTSGGCVCSYFPQPTCFYSGATVPASCNVGPAPPDLVCAIINPVTSRRPHARRVEVHAIFDTTTTVEFTGATYRAEIRRKVATGRWSNLPDNYLERRYTNVLRKGLVFKAQRKSRGQRYGAWAAQMIQTNGRTSGLVFAEAIGISQENSALYGPVYTMVSYVGATDPVVLRVYVPPNRVNRIEWTHTPLPTGPKTQLPAGNGQRTLTIQNLVSNTGIYEAAVGSRQLRTWHPIFHVMIRRCNSISFGAACSGVCTGCTASRGVCDETSGTCRCFAGYRHSANPGNDCGEPCPAGMVGQTCSINCATEFDRPGCRDVLFCSSYPVGCHCYQEDIAATGLVQPYCTCAQNKYGRNCENTCACTAAQICDSISGCIPNYLNI